jgi:pimeloyl-ACP methyl ester carboxylesterase
MPVPTIPGVTSKLVTTDRLRTRVLLAGAEGGFPVLFLHGNLSSATWWEETLVALPTGFLAIAPDLRGYGDADPAATIDATRGMADFSDDAFALMDALGHERFHLVGNSLGGVVAWWMMVAAPGRILSVTQASPGSPYGFGGTKGIEGTPTTPDFAGSGAGLVNPELVARIASGDSSTDSMFSPRSALRALVWKPPFIPDREDAFIEALLDIHLGAEAYPGDMVPSASWPFVAPGVHGPNNALSPRYGLDIEALVAIDPKPPVLWIRGAQDLAVSDTAASDPGTWGPLGIVPGYPGADAYPPQPMIGQTRAVLDRYAAAGGAYVEKVFDDCGHVPFIEKPDDFKPLLHAHLRENEPTKGTE